MTREVLIYGRPHIKCVTCGKFFDKPTRNVIAECSPCKELRKNPPTPENVLLTESYRELNRDYIAEQRAALSDKRRSLNHKRRARVNSAEFTFTEEEWRSCKAAFHYRCAYCRGELRLTQDHVVPVSKGGGYTRDNIVPACLPCNSSKHNRDFAEWFRRQPFYSDLNECYLLLYLTQNGVDSHEHSTTHS